MRALLCLLIVPVLGVDIAFSQLESRKVLLTPSGTDGNVAIAGYAVPPDAGSALPHTGSVLPFADGIPILLRDVTEVIDAVSKGHYDSVLFPILYDVDGVTAGKELAGFIKMQFVMPSFVTVLEPSVTESVESKVAPSAVAVAVDARVRP